MNTKFVNNQLVPSDDGAEKAEATHRAAQLDLDVPPESADEPASVNPHPHTHRHANTNTYTHNVTFCFSCGLASVLNC